MYGDTVTDIFQTELRACLCNCQLATVPDSFQHLLSMTNGHFMQSGLLTSSCSPKKLILLFPFAGEEMGAQKGHKHTHTHTQTHISHIHGLPWGLSGKKSACNAGAAGDVGSIPGLGRYPGKGKGNPLQYSCLEDPMERGAWWATVHRIAKTWTRLKRLGMHTHLIRIDSFYYFNGGVILHCVYVPQLSYPFIC